MHGTNNVKFVIYVISIQIFMDSFHYFKNTRVSITKIVSLIPYSEITAVYKQEDIKHMYTTKPNLTVKTHGT